MRINTYIFRFLLLLHTVFFQVPQSSFKYTCYGNTLFILSFSVFRWRFRLWHFVWDLVCMNKHIIIATWIHAFLFLGIIIIMIIIIIIIIINIIVVLKSFAITRQSRSTSCHVCYILTILSFVEYLFSIMLLASYDVSHIITI